MPYTLFSWNCFLGHSLKLVNDYGAAIYGILFVGISHHQREKQHRKTKEHFFIEYLCFANTCLDGCKNRYLDMQNPTADHMMLSFALRCGGQRDRNARALAGPQSLRPPVLITVPKGKNRLT